MSCELIVKNDEQCEDQLHTWIIMRQAAFYSHRSFWMLILLEAVVGHLVNYHFIENLRLCVLVKEFRKSFNIWWSCKIIKLGGLVFWPSWYNFAVFWGNKHWLIGWYVDGVGNNGWFSGRHSANSVRLSAEGSESLVILGTSGHQDRRTAFSSCFSCALSM